MKKLMIGTLLLIPLIIMAVVTLTANIVAGATYIGVESLTIETDYLELINVDQIYYAGDLLLPKVGPSRATNKTITWEIEDITLLDASYDDSVIPAVTLLDANEDPTDTNTTGIFKVNAYCSFELSAQAETQKATCMVFVGGYDVRKIMVSHNSNDYANVKVGDSVQLKYTVVPISAKINELRWESTNPGVAVVDENGIVTVKGTGDAKIKLSIPKYTTIDSNKEYVTSAEFTVYGKEGASKYGSVFTSHLKTLSLNAIGAYDVSNVEGATISGDTLTITGSSCSMQTKNGPLTIKTCEEGDIEIVHADIISNAAGYVLGFDEKLVLTAKLASALEGATINSTWSVSGDGFAINNGVLTATKDGIGTVTATYGSKSASVQVHAEEKITNLILGITNSTLKVGIGKETVFASSRYKDTFEREDNYVEITFKSPASPTSAAELDKFASKFTFTVDDPSKAYVVGTKLYFKKDGITEKCNITVTVSAKYYKYLPDYVTRTITFTVIDGVSVYTEPQLQKACDDRLHISLMADVVAIHQDYILNKDLYGNNHMISLDMPKDNIESWRTIFLVNKKNVISNITIRANEVDTEITNEDGAKGLKGGAVRIEWEGHDGWNSENKPGYDLRFESTVEYSTIENCSVCLRSYGADMVVNGCIIRNTSQVAIHTRARLYNEVDGVKYYEYSKITLRNVIFSNLLGTCLSMEYQDSFFLPDENGYTLGEQDADGNFIYKPTYEKERNIVLQQEGFVDIYNWQNIYELGLLSGLDVDETLIYVLKLALGDLFERSEFDQFRYTTGTGTGTTQQYVCMGFISNGILTPSVLDATFEDPRMCYLDTSKYPSIVDNDLYYRLLVVNKMKIFAYDASADIGPDDHPVINKATFNRLNPNKK